MSDTAATVICTVALFIFIILMAVFAPQGSRSCRSGYFVSAQIGTGEQAPDAYTCQKEWGK